ncbi:MAG: RNHCP domain-containing protein [Patescibacteria group bacterium]|nr:RNHCP domain-containing protein [Patescibacteria group bacterium]
MTKRFSRCVEDFVCENCGTTVKGDGYTDHCPECLFSKHVDINPGDRQSTCGGIMEPKSVENGKKGLVITFRCKKCDHTKRNRVSKNDNMENIIRLSRKYAEERR